MTTQPNPTQPAEEKPRSFEFCIEYKNNPDANFEAIGGFEIIPSIIRPIAQNTKIFSMTMTTDETTITIREIVE